MINDYLSQLNTDRSNEMLPALHIIHYIFRQSSPNSSLDTHSMNMSCHNIRSIQALFCLSLLYHSLSFLLFFHSFLFIHLVFTYLDSAFRKALCPGGTQYMFS